MTTMFACMEFNLWHEFRNYLRDFKTENGYFLR